MRCDQTHHPAAFQEYLASQARPAAFQEYLACLADLADLVCPHPAASQASRALLAFLGHQGYSLAGLRNHQGR